MKLRDADPAGVLFFARYLALAHDAYEAFMDARGVSFGLLLREVNYIIPVVHAESDYRVPLWAGEKFQVRLWVHTIRRRSFAIAYELRRADGTLSCTAQTVHAVVDKTTRRAIPLPQKVRQALETHSTR